VDAERETGTTGNIERNDMPIDDLIADLRRIDRRRKHERLPKKQAQRKHAINRIRQRYGFHISNHGFKNLLHQIQEGRSEFVEEQTNRTTVHIVRYEKMPILVVYDRQRQMIVTALQRVLDARSPGT